MIVDHRDVAAALRRLAVPDGLAMIADQLLGVVDTIAIGLLGADALAAISAASSVFLTFGIAVFAFATGPRILGAQAIGAGDARRFGAIVRSAVVVPLGIAVLVALASLAGARPLMHAMLGRIPSDADAAGYLILRCASLVPMVATGILIAAFGAAGETRLALRALLVINTIHIPLLAVLALGVATHHPLGVVGAGISSMLAESVGTVYCLWAATRRPQYHIYDAASIDPTLAWQSARLSFPEFIFLFTIVLPDPITIALLAPLGAEYVAAYRAFTVVSDGSWSLPGSLGDATQIVIGQRLGAGDLAGALGFFAAARRIALRMCSAGAALLAILAWPLCALVTASASIANLAAIPLALHACSLPLKGFAMVTLAPIRAAGDTGFAMRVGLVASILVIGALIVLIRWTHLGLYAVPIAWFLAWALRGSATSRAFAGGAWQRRRLAA